MKSFLFLIIVIFFSITLISAVQKNTQDINVTLQVTGKNATPDLLKQSADIISNRLKQYGINSASVKIVSDKGEVLVMLPDKTNLPEIEGLLISKGELSFYETYTHAEITKMFKPDSQIFRLLGSDQEKNSTADPRVGCSNSENKIKTEEFLRTSASARNSLFLWGNKSENSGYCLFALKTTQDGKPLMVRSDIASIKIAVGNDPQDLKIQIKLNPQAAKVFADATEKNLNKSIAIVIDDQVYSWPVVKSAITGGEIEVTGNFTKNEVNYFPALFNSAQLPLDFKILK